MFYINSINCHSQYRDDNEYSRHICGQCMSGTYCCPNNPSNDPIRHPIHNGYNIKDQSSLATTFGIFHITSYLSITSLYTYIQFVIDSIFFENHTYTYGKENSWNNTEQCLTL